MPFLDRIYHRIGALWTSRSHLPSANVRDGHVTTDALGVYATRNRLQLESSELSVARISSIRRPQKLHCTSAGFVTLEASGNLPRVSPSTGTFRR